MLCDKAQELLSAYLDQELPSHESLPLEKHVRGCPACSGRLAELREVRAILSSLEEVIPPEGFHASLHRRLLAVQAASAPTPAAPDRAAAVVPLAPVRRAARWSANRWVAAAAAAAVMAVSAGSYYLQALRPAAQSPPQVVISKTGTDANSPSGSGSTTPDSPGGVVTPVSNPTPTGPRQSDTGKSVDSEQGGAKPTANNGTSPNGGTAPQEGGIKPPAPNPPDGVGLAAEPGKTSSGNGVQPTSVTPPPAPDQQGPFLVYQADLQIEANLDEGSYRLISASQELGGTFESVGTSRLENGTPIAMFIIRVPVARYQEAKSRILAIGPAISFNEFGPRDVTAEINSRRQQIEDLLGQEKQLAASDQLKSIEQQIAEKQAELAQYYDQAHMATLRVTIIQPQS